MITNKEIGRGLNAISKIMTENRDYLVELDQRNGDGDLGISMDDGFSAVANFAKESHELDTADLFRRCATVFNEVAPSSLGTIMSFGFMGMAKYLKTVNSLTFKSFAEAMEAGNELIVQKTGTKLGEKTVLDSITPAIKTLIAHSNAKASEAFRKAAEAAATGAEATKKMRAVHGRAAYYGDASIGIIDGGAVVGKLLFEALSEEFSED